jgi:tetratricopeptide (TPR) repeat protein
MARGKIVDVLKYVLGLDTKDFEKNATKADQKIDKLGAGLSRLGKIAATAAAGFAAFKLLDFVKQATLVAARTQVLGTVVREVGRGAGYSAEYLDQLTERIKALGITTQSARMTITRFIQSNLDLADAAKLARVTQDLAVISGQNSSQAMETITRAIAGQRTIYLRQFGIVEDLVDVYKAHAVVLGKAAEQLTQVEKKQSLVNLIMEEGKKVAGAYEAAMGNVGKQATSLPRHFEEFQNALGKLFLPAYGEGVQILTKSLKGLRSILTDDLTLLSESMVKTEGKIASLKGKLPALVDEFVKLRDKTERTKDETIKLYEIQKRIDLLAPGLIEDVDAQGIAYDLSAESVGRFIDKLKLLGTTFGVLKQLNIQDQLKSLKEQARELREEQFLSKQFGPDYDPLVTPGLPEPYPRKLDEINKQLTEVGLNINLLEKALGNVGKEAESGLGKAIETTKELSEAAEEALRKIKIPPIIEDVDYALMRVKESLEEWDFHLALKIIDEEAYRANLNGILAELDEWGLQSTEAWLLANAKMESISAETADRIASDWQETNDAMQRAITLAPDRDSYRAALKAYRDMLTGMKRNLEAHGKTTTAQYAEIIEGIGDLNQELLADIQSVWDQAENAVHNYGDAVGNIFDNISTELGQLTRDLSNSVASIIAGLGTGGMLGGLQVFGGVISSLGSMFGL